MNKPAFIVLALLLMVMSLGAGAAAQDAAASRFTLAVIPDTQRYAAWNPDVFASQTQWIADNAAERNVVFTVHLGDITENDNVVEEWEAVSDVMAILENAGLQYSTVPGNHDIISEVPDNERDLSAELYPVYFPASRFENNPTFGGFTENGFNNYFIFEGAGQEFLVLGLDYVPSDETLAWAQGVLDAHATLPVILVAHSILTSTCELGDETCTDGAVFTSTGERLWEDFIRANAQIFLTINGHSWPPERMTLQNDAGNDVHLMLTNYQAEFFGGNGHMRLLEFDLVNSTISATTFSPWVMAKPENRRGPSDVVEKTDDRNQFVIDINFAERFAGFTELVVAQGDNGGDTMTDPALIEGTVAYWRFDGENTPEGEPIPAEGVVVTDVSGNGNDLVRVDLPNASP
ncbi:MAG: hypothetical protein GYB67_07045, partial [Chloroflexi bacterium]|nr:hypothetical protein [Chloroflexota bacterium]